MKTPATAGALPPVALLLHGSGRDGRATIDMWQGVAAAHGVLLSAPDSADPRGWTDQTESGAPLGVLLDDVASIHPFDKTRVYLDGHPAGANHALSIAASETGLWCAVAVHAEIAGKIPAPSASTAVPLRIQIGTADHIFDLESVRSSAEQLTEAGHNVDLVVIPRHDHWFDCIGPRLAQDACDFLATATAHPA